MQPSQDYSFSDFVNFGQNVSDLDKEIRLELLRAIKDAISTSFFSRSEGSGAELLENEVITPELQILFQLQLLHCIANYNASVSTERQIAVNPEMIDIVRGDYTGDYKILIRYIQLKDVDSGNPSTKQLTLPLTGG